MEAARLGLFMISACVFVVLLEYPASPARHALPEAWLRRTLIGVAMGLTAIGIIYSPWGKRSGAHINPAVTLTFFRLGKVAPWDALFYVVAQFVGATAGVLLSAWGLGMPIADPAVRYVVTVPGMRGVAAAFVAELVISFGLMWMVLWTTNTPRLAPLTGLFAGSLVALYIPVHRGGGAALRDEHESGPHRWFGHWGAGLDRALGILHRPAARHAAGSGDVPALPRRAEDLLRQAGPFQ